MRAVELELGELGYVLSSRLRERLTRSSLGELVAVRGWARAVLLAHVGANRKHEPLFRSFQGMERDRLVEDMLRHRSYWVWVGEFLHPHEYASRFPNVARAFHVARKQAPDGTWAPRFRTWHSRLEEAVCARDAAQTLPILAERPGEFARRSDHIARVASGDVDRGNVVAKFTAGVPRLSTPVLLTLLSHLPARAEKAPVRVYWPKGRVAKGVSSPDERAVLPGRVIQPAVGAIQTELLRRFGAKPGFGACLIDEGLRTVAAPFNEQTASRSAISVPRGSRIIVPAGKLVRLFLHWCQPEEGGQTTDLDLSVGLYDESWGYVGVCSYYQLKATGKDGSLIAQSAGDLRDAPWPEGATEFVDSHRERALAAGVRYAVMVVNAYDFAGSCSSRLSRGSSSTAKQRSR